MSINKQLANTQDLVDIEEIKEGVAILKSGALRQVVMVSGINTALMAESELDIISNGYKNFLNGLDFPIQIIIHSRKINIERYLAILERRREQEPSALLQSQISEYIQYISGFVKDNAVMEKTFLVVVPFSSSKLPTRETISGISKLFPFLNKGGKEDEKKKEEKAVDLEFRENLNQITQRTAQVIEGLTTFGIEAVPLDNQALVELFYNFYNPETVEKEMSTLPSERLETKPTEEKK